MTRLPDFVMWPVQYFDSTTYSKFMSAPSIEVCRAAARPRDRDSILLKAYHHYLHPDGPLVVRSEIRPPDGFRKKQWPDVKEYGKYLLIDKGRCRYMEIGRWYPVITGMRVWDVDSIEPGLITKGGWMKGTEESLGWSFMDGLMVYLRHHGTEFFGSRW